MRNFVNVFIIVIAFQFVLMDVRAADVAEQQVDPEMEALTKIEAKLVLQKKVEDAARALALSRIKHSELLLQEKSNLDADAAIKNSEILNETAKITAIKSIVGETKAGKLGTVTAGNEALTIVPLGGTVDTEAFTMVARGICSNIASSLTTGRLFVSSKDDILQARMYGLLYSDLRQNISTAKSIIPGGVDVVQRYNDAMLSADANKKGQKIEPKSATKGLPAVLSGLSILPNVANTIADLTKVFRSDYTISLRESSSGTDFMIGRIVAEPKCLNESIKVYGLTGVEHHISDAAMSIIRIRQEGELVKQTLTILSDEARAALRDEKMQRGEFSSLKNAVTSFLIEAGNLLKAMDQLNAASNIESTKQDAGLWSTARRVAIYSFINQNDVAVLLIDATRHTNTIRKSSVFSSDQLNKAVTVTADYQLLDSSGKTVVMASTDETAIANLNNEFK